MRLGLRLLLGYFIIVAVAAFFVFNIFLKEIKPGVRRATEDTLVDTAQVLAAVAAQDMDDGHIADGHLATALGMMNRQPVNARISGVSKTRVEYQIYVTDDKGIVLYDSTGRNVGRDYSRWNDVYLTLRGRYGVRSTRTDPNDDLSSTMYVAAPIMSDGKIIGVLSVSKANRVFIPIMHASEQRVLTAGLWLLGIALLIGIVMVWWINRDIKRLIGYADAVSDGQAAALPRRLGSTELNRLAGALENMRRRLEGKEYVTRYVHALTHELKSPLAAVRGAAEILQEDPPAEARQRFSGNIQQQTLRMQRLIDKMLLQARLESQLTLDSEPLDFAALVSESIESKAAPAAQRQITIHSELAPVSLRGDTLLLSQAVSNLLDNALDFSPDGGTLIVRGEQEGNDYRLTVRDHGPGVPDYALGRVFERFYSLPRENGGKSTGLGLSFVHEVAQRHGGRITLHNHPEGGAVAVLTLPLANPS